MVRTGNTATATQMAAFATTPDYIKAVTGYSSRTGIGTVNYYEKGKSQTQVNTSITYRFSAEAPQWIRRTTVRLGVNNILDANPSPANTSSTGYGGGSGGSLWVGRAFTLATSREF